MLDISIGQYESFVAVFEHQNVSKAAEVIGKSTSSVSQSLKQLSGQLDVRLFHPHTRGMTPTSEAITFYPQAKQALDSFKQSIQSIKEFNAESEAVVRIIIPSSSLIVFSPYFKEFIYKYPNTKIELTHRSNDDNFDQLMRGKVDFAIGVNHFNERLNLKTIDLMETKTIFIVKRGVDVSTAPIIGTGAVEACTGMKPTIKTATVESTYSLVKNGAGIGLYFENLLNAQKPDDIEIVELEGVSLPTTKIILGYKTLTRAAQAFIDGLLEFIKDLG